tara:strand:+ start:637 stop:747 length:111 start_codon:yes stop_codon:yes gene_type:complete
MKKETKKFIEINVFNEKLFNTAINKTKTTAIENADL